VDKVDLLATRTTHADESCQRRSLVRLGTVAGPHFAAVRRDDARSPAVALEEGVIDEVQAAGY
jgi:hypothetical protein